MDCDAWLGAAMHHEAKQQSITYWWAKSHRGHLLEAAADALAKAKLDEADFGETKAGGIDLNGASLNRADFIKTDLTGLLPAPRLHASPIPGGAGNGCPPTLLSSDATFTPHSWHKPTQAPSFEAHR